MAEENEENGKVKTFSVLTIAKNAKEGKGPDEISVLKHTELQGNDKKDIKTDNLKTLKHNPAKEKEAHKDSKDHGNDHHNDKDNDNIHQNDRGKDGISRKEKDKNSKRVRAEKKDSDKKTSHDIKDDNKRHRKSEDDNGGKGRSKSKTNKGKIDRDDNSDDRKKSHKDQGKHGNDDDHERCEDELDKLRRELEKAYQCCEETRSPPVRPKSLPRNHHTGDSHESDLSDVHPARHKTPLPKKSGSPHQTHEPKVDHSFKNIDRDNFPHHNSPKTHPSHIPSSRSSRQKTPPPKKSDSPHQPFQPTTKNHPVRKGDYLVSSNLPDDHHDPYQSADSDEVFHDKQPSPRKTRPSESYHSPPNHSFPSHADDSSPSEPYHSSGADSYGAPPPQKPPQQSYSSPR